MISGHLASEKKSWFIKKDFFYYYLSCLCMFTILSSHWILTNIIQYLRVKPCLVFHLLVSPNATPALIFKCIVLQKSIVVTSILNNGSIVTYILNKGSGCHWNDHMTCLSKQLLGVVAIVMITWLATFLNNVSGCYTTVTTTFDSQGTVNHTLH